MCLETKRNRELYRFESISEFEFKAVAGEIDIQFGPFNVEEARVSHIGIVSFAAAPRIFRSSRLFWLDHFSHASGSRSYANICATCRM